MSQRESDTESSWKTKLIHLGLQLPNDIIDFIFPRICIVSGERIPEGNSNPYVTDSILNSLVRISSKDKAELLSKIHADECISVFTFSGECDMSHIIHTMKYKGFKSVGELLGRILGEELKCQHLYCDYIIPVPVHKARLRERGFNQSYHISKGVCKIIGGEVIDDLVVRVRNTRSQTTLSKAERSSNVKEAFEINAKYKQNIENYRVLIVDDVITTGATVNEIAKALRTCKVKKVIAASVAMAS